MKFIVSLEMRALTLLCFTFVALASCYKNYDGHKVFRTEKLTVSKTQLLRDFHISSGLDFWREAAPGQTADIMVSSSNMDMVSEWLNYHGINFDVMVEDVQQLIEETKPRNVSARGTFDWTDYYPHDDLNTLIQGWADANADFARIINIGKSFEGRDMNVLAIEKVLICVLTILDYCIF